MNGIKIIFTTIDPKVGKYEAAMPNKNPIGKKRSKPNIRVLKLLFFENNINIENKTKINAPDENLNQLIFLK